MKCSCPTSLETRILSVARRCGSAAFSPASETPTLPMLMVNVSSCCFLLHRVWRFIWSEKIECAAVCAFTSERSSIDFGASGAQKKRFMPRHSLLRKGLYKQCCIDRCCVLQAQKYERRRSTCSQNASVSNAQLRAIVPDQPPLI